MTRPARNIERDDVVDWTAAPGVVTIQPSETATHGNGRLSTIRSNSMDYIPCKVRIPNCIIPLLNKRNSLVAGNPHTHYLHGVSVRKALHRTRAVVIKVVRVSGKIGLQQ